MSFNWNPILGKRNNNKATQIVDCLHVGDTNYTPAAGFDFATYAADFSPLDSEGKELIMHGFDIGAGTGVISVILEGGGKKDITFTVAVGESKRAFWGERIKTLVYADTTFSGYIWPNI